MHAAFGAGEDCASKKVQRSMIRRGHAREAHHAMQLPRASTQHP